MENKGIRIERYPDSTFMQWQWYIDNVCHRYYGPQDSRGNWYIHGKRIAHTV